MVVVLGTFSLPAENIAEGRTAMARVIAASRAEPGCIDYAYAEDLCEAGLFRVSECWNSRDALATHFQTPHMQQWIVERDALGMSDRRVVCYTVIGEEVL